MSTLFHTKLESGYNIVYLFTICSEFLKLRSQNNKRYFTSTLHFCNVFFLHVYYNLMDRGTEVSFFLIILQTFNILPLEFQLKIHDKKDIFKHH